MTGIVRWATLIPVAARTSSHAPPRYTPSIDLKVGAIRLASRRKYRNYLETIGNNVDDRQRMVESRL